MTDALPIIEATKLGYELYSDESNLAWYKYGNLHVGPYNTLEDAAYDAISEHETNEAYKLWKSRDANL